MNKKSDKKILLPVAGNSRGFSLVELMLTVVISAIIMGAIYSAYIVQQRTSLAQGAVTEMQQNIRSGLMIMSKDIRTAGFDPTGNAGAGFVTATAGQIAFTSDVNENGQLAGSDGVPETGEYMSYDIYDSTTLGSFTLGSQSSGTANHQPVAENIENIEFYYLLKDGSQTTDASASLKKIRSVQVSILARASRADRTFTNTETYTTASDATWGPNNDNFRRRLFITTIQCRNMGLED